jgi:hypothetical protein
MIRLLLTHHLPPLFRQQVVSPSQSSCVAGRAGWRERGEGEGVIHRPREGLALYKPFNTFWKQLFISFIFTIISLCAKYASSHCKKRYSTYL